MVGTLYCVTSQVTSWQIIPSLWIWVCSLVKRVTASSLHCKSTYFSLQLVSKLWHDTLALCKYPVTKQLSHNGFISTNNLWLNAKIISLECNMLRFLGIFLEVNWFYKSFQGKLTCLQYGVSLSINMAYLFIYLYLLSNIFIKYDKFNYNAVHNSKNWK